MVPFFQEERGLEIVSIYAVTDTLVIGWAGFMPTMRLFFMIELCANPIALFVHYSRVCSQLVSSRQSKGIDCFYRKG